MWMCWGSMKDYDNRVTVVILVLCWWWRNWWIAKAIDSTVWFFILCMMKELDKMRDITYDESVLRVCVMSLCPLSFGSLPFTWWGYSMAIGLTYCAKVWRLEPVLGGSVSTYWILQDLSRQRRLDLVGFCWICHCGGVWILSDLVGSVSTGTILLSLLMWNCLDLSLWRRLDLVGSFQVKMLGLYRSASLEVFGSFGLFHHGSVGLSWSTSLEVFGSFVWKWMNCWLI